MPMCVYFMVILMSVWRASSLASGTEMFLSIRRRRPELIQQWIDEDRLAPYRRGEKLPDAIIADHAGASPRLVLEFGSGNYGVDRLRAFHDDCELRGLPYEIW